MTPEEVQQIVDAAQNTTNLGAWVPAIIIIVGALGGLGKWFMTTNAKQREADNLVQNEQREKERALQKDLMMQVIASHTAQMELERSHQASLLVSTMKVHSAELATDRETRITLHQELKVKLDRLLESSPSPSPSPVPVRKPS